MPKRLKYKMKCHAQNWAPRSTTISFGIPKCQMTSRFMMSSAPLAEQVSEVVMSWTHFLWWSMIMQMALWPLLSGRPVIKSMLMHDQGPDGSGRGWRRPAFRDHDSLAWQHGAHDWTKWQQSSQRPSHVKSH